MAKIAIKRENIMPFRGFYNVMDVFLTWGFKGDSSNLYRGTVEVILVSSPFFSYLCGGGSHTGKDRACGSSLALIYPHQPLLFGICHIRGPIFYGLYFIFFVIN